MNRIERDVLDSFKREVIRRLPLCRIVLFGSRARGDAESDSDMDVLVVIDGQVGAQERKSVSECAWEAGFEQGIVVSPTTVSRQDWEESPMRSSLLAIAVEREGVAV